MIGLIVAVLVFKQKYLFDHSIEEDLKIKWIKYLDVLPTLINKSRIHEFLKNKERANKIIKKICSPQESEIIKWFIKGVPPEYIAIKYNKDKTEILMQLTKIIEKIKDEVEKDELFE